MSKAQALLDLRKSKHLLSQYLEDYENILGQDYNLGVDSKYKEDIAVEVPGVHIEQLYALIIHAIQSLEGEKK